VGFHKESGLKTIIRKCLCVASLSAVTVLAGCGGPIPASIGYIHIDDPSERDDYVCQGPIPAVAKRIAKTLRKNGMLAARNDAEDSIVISSITPTNVRFSVVISPLVIDGEKVSRVHIATADGRKEIVAHEVLELEYNGRTPLLD
jgi:hypothetical protein